MRRVLFYPARFVINHTTILFRSHGCIWISYYNIFSIFLRTGGYLKTHDFLRPLERIGKTCAKEEKTIINVSSAERAAPPLATPAHNSSVERLLPGGIGTYSISHISYFNQRVSKPEGSMFSVAQASNTDKSDDNNSRCNSLSGSGFTLWEESAVKKGKTRKENLADKPGLRGKVFIFTYFSVLIIHIRLDHTQHLCFHTPWPQRNNISLQIGQQSSHGLSDVGGVLLTS